MLPLLLIIFFHLSKCLKDEPVPLSAPLTEQLHKSLLKVNAFLEDVQHKIRNQRDALRGLHYEEHTPEQDFLDYSLTSFWWNGTPATGQITPQTSFLTIPEFQRVIFVTPTQKTVSLVVTVPESTKKPFTSGTDTPRPTFATLPPDYESTPYYDPVLGEYLGPPGEILGTSPQYSVEQLATLTRTTPTPSTTPDPRPKGPGYDLAPDEGFPTTDVESTPRSPGYPTESELKPEDLDRKPYINTSEIYPPSTSTTEDYPVVPEHLFTPEVQPNPTTLTPPEQDTTDVPYPEETITFDPEPYPSTPQEIPSIFTSYPIDTTTLHPNISQHVEQWIQEMSNASGVNASRWSTLPQYSYIPIGNKTTWNHESEGTLYPEYTPEPPAYMTPNSSYPVPDDFLHKRQGILKLTTELDGPTATGIQEGMILDDAFGLPYLGTSPTTLESIRTTIVEGRPANIPAGVDFNWATPSTAGDVLHGHVTDNPDPKDEYLEDIYKEMDRLDIGYMSMFLIKITRLVATGKQERLKPVLMHTEFVLTRYFNLAQLAYLGQPLLRVTMNIGMAVSSAEFDELQSYASMVHFMLLHRKQTSAVDVNSIMDYADSLYNDEEGERLFVLLKDFETYPNNTMPGRMLCESIIEAFMSPHRRLKGSERGQRLIDSLNYALESRFPHLKNARRFWEKSGRKNNGPPIHTTIKSIHTMSKRRVYNSSTDRKKPRHKNNNGSDVSSKRNYRRGGVSRRPNDKKKLSTRHNEYNYESLIRRNQFNPNSLELQRRIQQTITTANVQKRFNVITSEHLNNYSPLIQSPDRTKKTTTWTPPFIQLDMRPTTDYKLDNKMFGVYKPGFRAHTKRPVKFFQKPSGLVAQPKDKTMRFTKRKKRKLTTVTRNELSYSTAKTDLLRMIVEGSSYSDEEEALKLNLISAMIHGNRTFHRTEINETILRAFLKEQEALTGAPIGGAKNLDDISRGTIYPNRNEI